MSVVLVTLLSGGVLELLFQVGELAMREVLEFCLFGLMVKVTVKSRQKLLMRGRGD